MLWRDHDEIINVGKNCTVLLFHHVQDGVRGHLKRSRPMDPAKRGHYVQKVLIPPLDTKSEGVNWIHPKVPEGPCHINF